MLMTAMLGSALATAKPLKIYIMAGQSNMQGYVGPNTFPYMLEDPATVTLHNRLVAEDGKTKVHEGVHVSLITDYGTHQGPLTAGFGGRKSVLGPELAFGATMHEKLQEPILIIKAAWGGRTLHSSFRPPSAGPYVYSEAQIKKYTERFKITTDELYARKVESTGHYYRLMLEHVGKVLADPGKYHPAYDKDEGYEIAGFVWFQGWNDLVDGGTYANRGAPGSYDAYTKVLGHFIRDVRKELDLPKMPFVIGVMGVNGSYLNKTQSDRRHIEFQKAMAATAELPEFQGNVFNVHTGLYWDKLQTAAITKKWEIRGEAKKLVKEGKLGTKEQIAYENRRIAEIQTPEEAIAYKGISNKAFHYLGSAKIVCQIGEAFAEALINKKGNKPVLTTTPSP